jgi:hypothetical protein
MRRLTPLLAVALAACGLGDTATTAAVGAKTRAQELEQARAAQQRVIGDIDKATQQAEQRLRDAEAR